MPPDQLVESFNDYFIQKITRIRIDLNELAFDLPPELSERDPDKASTSFATFGTASGKDFEKIVSSETSESCAQDPIHTWILNQSKEELLPTITEFVNLSWRSCKFPKQSFGQATDKEDIPWPIGLQELSACLQPRIYIQGYWKSNVWSVEIMHF